MRLIRPLYVARLAVLMLGMGLCLPAPSVDAATRHRSRSSASAKSSVRKATPRRSVRPAYSARSSQARKARLARARAAARAREFARLRALQEAMTPRYKTDENGALVPDVRAAAAIIFDPANGQVLWQENAQDKRSIASITKVMTAVVFLESDPDLSEVVAIERSDTYAASTTHLRPNYMVSVRDLLHLMLISSDNAAARAVARVSPWGSAGFVARMNEKATELGLQSTTYADPSGLAAANVSSAYDMARLIAYAASNDRISEIMRKAEYTLPLGRRPITIHSTNRLLTRSDFEDNVLGAKTGFIGESGYCLATLLKLPSVNQQVAVVVLGARSNIARFNEVRNLFTWLSGRAQDLFGKKEEQQQ